MEGIMIVKGTLSYKEERMKTQKKKAKRTLPDTGSQKKARKRRSKDKEVWKENDGERNTIVTKKIGWIHNKKEGRRNYAVIKTGRQQKAGCKEERCWKECWSTRKGKLEI
jgi:hypothetical protein